MSAIRVAIVDDQTLVRASFRLLIDSTEGMAVVGEAADGVEAVAVVAQQRPDVVLMDVRMPLMDGIAATRAITGNPETAAARVLVLTTYDLDEYVYAALRAGASGFLLKDALPADLLAAIRVLAAGDALLAPAVTRRLISEFAARPAQVVAPPGLLDPAALDGLTGREREVLLLVARGLSNAEIADHLRVSLATAKTHLSHLLTKLGARDRVQLVIFAYEVGLARAVHESNRR